MENSICLTVFIFESFPKREKDIGHIVSGYIFGKVKGLGDGD